MIGEIINCMSMTNDGRCARCAVCRIVIAIERLQAPETVNNIDDMRRHLDRIADELGVISEVMEETA
jgi:hypothetical protein